MEFVPVLLSLVCDLFWYFFWSLCLFLLSAFHNECVLWGSRPKFVTISTTTTFWRPFSNNFQPYVRYRGGEGRGTFSLPLVVCRFRCLEVTSFLFFGGGWVGPEYGSAHFQVQLLE